MPVIPIRRTDSPDGPRQAGRRAIALLLLALAGAWLVLHRPDGVGSFAENPYDAPGRLPGARSPSSPLDAIHCAERLPGQAREVAVVDFKGGIGGALDSDAVFGLMNRIAGNRAIGGIALRIDSTGGNSYVAKKLHEILLRTKLQCRLPMAAFIGNAGTSGGYWMSLAADEIHADTLSTVGAVGVIAIYTNESEKQAREGIRHSVIRTGERKWPMNPYLPVASDDEQKIRESLEIVLAEFLAAVVNSRGTRLQLARDELATGEAWMGIDAERLGLTDGAGDLGSVFSRLLGGTPTAYRQFDLAKAAATEKATPEAK